MQKSPFLAWLCALAFCCSSPQPPSGSTKTAAPPPAPPRDQRGEIASPTVALPAPRAGGDVVGGRFDTSSLRWLGTPPGAPKAILFRWWTDSCPYCEKTLPALEELRLRYGPKGLVTLAVYHPKPPRDVPDEAILAAAKERGYSGPLASDPHWEILGKIWLDTGARDATSVSFLVDTAGVIRFVHPGPEYHPSAEPDHQECDQDFSTLERAIQAVLSEAPGERPPVP